MEDDKLQPSVGAMMFCAILVMLSHCHHYSDRDQQNAQSTGDDTSQSMNGNHGQHGRCRNRCSYGLRNLCSLGPGSEPLATDQIFYRYRENSATPIEGSDPVVDEMTSPTPTLQPFYPTCP